MEDLPMLVSVLLQDVASRIDRGPFTVDEAVLDLIRRYAWPGNVRELRACLEHAALVADGNRITPKDLPSYIMSATDAPTNPDNSGTLPLLHALRQTGGNVAKAARLLGISRSTIYRRLRQIASDT
jgi:transcriptional regulator of acetoin/glycerol metabolism